jgi:putative ABC transport system ATP-binding protein
MSFVSCESLVKIYKVADLEVFALQGLDLEVQPGEVMAIIGSSGSGKSTLLNILGGLDLPTAGTCRVGTADLLRLNPTERVRYQREAVGFVWQNNARNLIPYLTALENATVPMWLAGRSDRGAQEWALHLLDAVGLKHRAHHQLMSLSGGEQQRVAIALALSNRPQLLLADEPTGSVDTKTAGEIMAVLRMINQMYGTTIIIVTHDHSLARSVDRYVQIQDGKVSQEVVRRAVGETWGAAADTHEETVVLDRAGRLQIPREFLERVGLTNRARVELEGDRVVIRRP